MIKTLVIAAAGRGSRMKHLAENRPKHLIPVCGKPFLHYVLEYAARVGFERIIVVVGHMQDQMRAFLETQTEYPITVVDQNEQVGDKYGSAAVVEAVEHAVGNEPFVFINGDNLYTDEMLRVVAQSDEFHRVVGMHHENPSLYGVIEAGRGMLLERIVEKPEEPKCDVINLGVYAFQSEIFDYVKKLQLSARNEYEIIDAINMLAVESKVKVVQVGSEDWLDFGKPSDVITVEQYLRDHGLCDSTNETA